MSCGYQGVHFGAWYADSVCIEGYLWDLDSCDEPGGPLRNGGDTACPACNTAEYVDDTICLRLSGNARQRRTRRREAVREVLKWVHATSST
jgi:hypothetical protein